MNIKAIAGTASLTVGVAAVAIGCVPPGDNSSRCGQTADGTAVIGLVGQSNCSPLPGQRYIAVDENCGPIMEGSLAVDDCYRGYIPGRGIGNFRYGSITAVVGGQVLAFVASDATAA